MIGYLRHLHKVFAIVLCLAVTGVARWPVESRVTESFKASGILPQPLELGMRDQLSQNAYVAAFGGFRSLIASLTAMQADVSWQKKEWGEVERSYEVVTGLQPRVASYWEAASWHMAYNAASYYLEDWQAGGVTDDLRREYWERYIERGHRFLRDGMVWNPESWQLPMLAGRLFSNQYKLIDHQKAAEYFEQAARRDGAPDYLKRQAVYELTFLPSRRKEAMDRLMELYRASENNRTPRLVAALLDLQLGAGVPDGELVSIRDLGETSAAVATELIDYKSYFESLGGEVSKPFERLAIQLQQNAKSAD